MFPAGPRGPRPQPLQAAQKEYIQDNDDVGDFVTSHCEVGVGKDFVINTTVLREAFQKASETSIDAKHFKKAMIARGFVAKPSRLQGVMCQAFQGVRLKDV